MASYASHTCHLRARGVLVLRPRRTIESYLFAAVSGARVRYDGQMMMTPRRDDGVEGTTQFYRLPR